MLKQKIERLIRIKNPRARELERDIKILMEYFGFGEDRFPTQEVLGFKHRKEFFKNKNNSKEIDVQDFDSLPEEKKKSYQANISLILNEKFKNRVGINEIPELLEIEKLLQEKDYIFYTDFISLLLEDGLLDEILHIKGLINLLNCFSHERDFDVCTLNITPAKKKDIENKEDEALIIVKSNVAEKLRKSVQNIKKIPSHTGFCCLDAVYEDSKNYGFTYSEIKRILRNSDDVWSKDINGKLWFLVHSRTNPIVNSLAKIKKVASAFDKHIMPSIIANKLSGHSDEKIRKYRPIQNKNGLQEIISAYLDDSQYIDASENFYILSNSLQETELTDVEEDLFDFFEQKTTGKRNEIFQFLKERNKRRKKPYSDANLNKYCFNSPLLYKKEVSTATRRGERFEYIFIKQYTKPSAEISIDRYQDYRIKLSNLNGQTDIVREQKTRNEQDILRNWLFEDLKFEKCAICGKEYSVSSLVAAHKKKRANCSTTEKTDPNIVMPLCRFGCDDVYEKRWVKIEDGVIKENVARTNDISKDEKNYIDSLVERKLDERWIKGNLSYFDEA